VGEKILSIPYRAGRAAGYEWRDYNRRAIAAAAAKNLAWYVKKD
jgi:hypothetical protein